MPSYPAQEADILKEARDAYNAGLTNSIYSIKKYRTETRTINYKNTLNPDITDIFTIKITWLSPIEHASTQGYFAGKNHRTPADLQDAVIRHVVNNLNKNIHFEFSCNAEYPSGNGNPPIISIRMLGESFLIPVPDVNGRESTLLTQTHIHKFTASQIPDNPISIEIYFHNEIAEHIIFQK